jgi:hypothetical protein
MSDSRRCSRAGSENMGETKIKNFIHGRVQRQKCSAKLAPIQVLALLLSLKSANSLLWVKILTQNKFLCVFASIPTVLETLGSLCSSK